MFKKIITSNKFKKYFFYGYAALLILPISNGEQFDASAIIGKAIGVFIVAFIIAAIKIHQENKINGIH